MHKNQASRILSTVRMALAGRRKTHVHGMPGAGTVPGKGEKAEGEPGEGTDSKYRGSHQNGKGTGRYLWPDGGDPGREDENGMSEIKCPYDLNQFILGEPIFENPFPEEECEKRKFYGDCYHCFSTAIASRDHQLKALVTDNIMNKIKSIVAEWKTDTWTDNLSYECMSKIADVLAEGSDKE